MMPYIQTQTLDNDLSQCNLVCARNELNNLPLTLTDTGKVIDAVVGSDWTVGCN